MRSWDETQLNFAQARLQQLPGVHPHSQRCWNSLCSCIVRNTVRKRSTRNTWQVQGAQMTLSIQMKSLDIYREANDGRTTSSNASFDSCSFFVSSSHGDDDALHLIRNGVRLRQYRISNRERRHGALHGRVLPNGEFYDITGIQLLENKLLGVRETHRLAITIEPTKWQMGKVIKKL